MVFDARSLRACWVKKKENFHSTFHLQRHKIYELKWHLTFFFLFRCLTTWPHAPWTSMNFKRQRWRSSHFFFKRLKVDVCGSQSQHAYPFPLVKNHYICLVPVTEPNLMLSDGAACRFHSHFWRSFESSHFSHQFRSALSFIFVAPLMKRSLQCQICSNRIDPSVNFFRGTLQDAVVVNWIISV